MKLVVALWLVTFISNFVSSLGINSGVKLQISQYGLNYAAEVAVEILARDAVNQKIEDHKEEDGNLKYEIKNIKIDQFRRPSVSVVVSPESSSITWSLTEAQIQCSADWSFRKRINRFLKISDSGSMTLTANGLSIEVTFGFGFNPSLGTPTVNTHHCTSRINDLDLEFRGRTSMVYDLLARFVKNPIRQALEGKMCQLVRKAIDENANRELSSLNVEASLGDGLYFDYKLTSVPQIKAGYIESSHVGTVFGGPVPRGSLPLEQSQLTKDPGDLMLSILLSEDSLNSYSNVLFMMNKMKILITRDCIHGAEKVYFDTNCRSLFCIPRLISKAAKSMQNASVEIDYEVEEAPKLNIRSGEISSNVSSRAHIYIRLSNGSTLDLFKLRLHTALNLTIRIENGFLKFKLEKFIPYIEILDMNREDALDKGLLFAIKIASKTVTVKANEYGEKGIPLPKARATIWEDSRLSFEDRFLHLQTNVRRAD